MTRQHGPVSGESAGRLGAGDPVPEALLLRRNRQLEALYSVVRTVNTSLDLDDLLQQALEQALCAVEFPSGIVRLLDAPTGALSLTARAGLDPELEAELSRTVRLGQGPSGAAAQRRSLVVIEDLPGSPHRETAWAKHGYRTFVAVPLQCRGMLLGCMSIASPELRPPDEADREVLSAVANQVGMALANAELYAGAERKIQYLSGLHQFSRDVGPAPDLDRVLRLTTERMAQLLGLDRTAVLFCSADARELCGAASYPPLDEIDGLRMPVAELPAVEALLRRGEPVLSSDPVGEQLLSAELVQALGLGTAIAIPLVAHDQILGLLVGGRDEDANGAALPLPPRSNDSAGRTAARRDLLLSADETELAMIFAHKAALWITSARLFVQEHEARSQAEAAESRFRGLLESAPDGIVCVDREGRIALLNPQVESLFGYRREELLGQPVEMLMPDRFRSAHTGHRVRYGADPHTRPMGAGLDLLGRRRDGSEFPVEISLSPMQSPEGPLVIGVVRDVTLLKQAEQERTELLKREREKSEQLKLSIREAHHRIKNNLQAISDLLYLELTQGEGGSPEEALRESIDRVQAIATVHDLLSQDEDVRVVDARAVMDRLVPMVLRSSGVSPDRVTVRTDVQSVPLSSKRATVLALIVNELVSNALKHACKAGSGSEIDLSLRQDSEELVLRVRDNGPGLPEGFSIETHSHVGLDVVRILAERDLNGSFTLTGRRGVLAEVRFVW